MTHRDDQRKSGFFISFEGPEGVGKSTQLERLVEVLRARGHVVCQTREPGGTVLGEELRRLLKHLPAEDEPGPVAELLLITASRAQLVENVIEPALSRGEIVVCDRFADSTTVYQGCARGLDMKLIKALHTATVRGTWPDLTVVIDMDVKEGLRRGRLRQQEGDSPDRFEAESHSFHETVRQGFLELAREVPGRVQVISGKGSPDDVHERIMRVVDRALG
ncbi:MAG: dTMP kinase [Candidatus Pacebacteria bacterium]|nr:dTMP kinase [Candidatus Paceibacterota bacterium]